MPTSRVRSTTVASMMFMMPIPPTTSEIVAMRPRKTMNMSCVVRACSNNSSGTTTAKSGIVWAYKTVFRTTSAVSDGIAVLHLNRDLRYLIDVVLKLPRLDRNDHVPFAAPQRRRSEHRCRS